MQSIKDEFSNDLNVIQNSISLLELLDQFKSEQHELDPDNDQFISKCEDLQQQVRENSRGVVILKGTLVLYLAGRFEIFVRNLFEECSIRFANQKGSYSKLPEKMQTELLKKTTEVLLNHKKFGFSIQDRNLFLKNLSDNVNNNNIQNINSQCLSITNTNMRPDVINDMYKVIGINNIWNEIGKQTNVKTFFGSGNDQVVTRQAKELLNKIMDIRNDIAHPSESITWPGFSDIRKYCTYFDLISNQLFSNAELHLAVNATSAT